MAGKGAQCAACRRAGVRENMGKGVVGCRQAVARGGQRHSADDDRLFAQGEAYGRCGRRVPRRGLSRPGH